MEDVSTWTVVSWVLGIGVTVAIAVIGGVIKHQNDDHKTTKAKLDEMQKDHSNFRVEVANKYVSHEHFQQFETRMEKRFDELKAILMTAFTNGRE